MLAVLLQAMPMQGAKLWDSCLNLSVARCMELVKMLENFGLRGQLIRRKIANAYRGRRCVELEI